MQRAQVKIIRANLRKVVAEASNAEHISDMSFYDMTFSQLKHKHYKSWSGRANWEAQQYLRTGGQVRSLFGGRGPRPRGGSGGRGSRGSQKKNQTFLENWRKKNKYPGRRRAGASGSRRRGSASLFVSEERV